MQLLEYGHHFKVGDVVMVHDTFTPRGTTQQRPWKWLGIIAKVARGRAFRAYRIGATNPDYQYKQVALPAHSDAPPRVYLLDESEWPDGVWVERTRLILEGAIDI